MSPLATRVRIHVYGQVQGVGFRPFVCLLAHRLGLTGSVENQGDCVLIEAQGSATHLASFLDSLRSEAPSASRVASIEHAPISPRFDAGSFSIREATTTRSGGFVLAPDRGICESCRAEVGARGDRRFGYAFTHCAACGPRLSVVHALPYDRSRTSMDAFPMCDDCEAEYTSSEDRRYHAEINACPRCGPQLLCADRDASVTGDAALQRFAAKLREGRIGALLGFGGYHLVCLADADAPLRELRARKRRPDKPFAVMVRDLSAARRIAHVADDEAVLLSSAAGPIVLLRQRSPALVSPLCAPGLRELGLFLPYSALHQCLFDACEVDALIMTSANVSSAPMIHRDTPAREQLRALADVCLSHDRNVVVPCEDSVLKVHAAGPQFVRRSRGFVPTPLSLAPSLPNLPALAVGAHQRATFALAKNGQACLSPFLGDLGHFDNLRGYEVALDHFQQLFEIRPELVVRDCHPDYATSDLAEARAWGLGVPCIAVQHHHAHLASVLIEHGVTSETLGVIFDGSGFGHDHSVWGGEFLLGNLRSCARVGHLRSFRLPGGERAIREPWRVALSLLIEAGLEPRELLPEVPDAAYQTIRKLCLAAPSALAPASSSAGRLFDAASVLVLRRSAVSYDGQAPVELEALAAACDDTSRYPYEISSGEPLSIDWRPTFRALVEDRLSRTAPARIARRFHNTMTSLIVETCVRLARRHGIERIALSGGVFHNGLVFSETQRLLSQRGFSVLTNRQVAPNDSGLCLGQLAVGMALACA